MMHTSEKKEIINELNKFKKKKIRTFKEGQGFLFFLVQVKHSKEFIH